MMPTFSEYVEQNRTKFLHELEDFTSQPSVAAQKLVMEGEEEIGSPNLGKFVAANHALIDGADGCLWEFGAKDLNGNPMLICGLKGIVYFELHAHGAERDLHSGAASIVENPAWRL